MNKNRTVILIFISSLITLLITLNFICKKRQAADYSDKSHCFCLHLFIQRIQFNNISVHTSFSSTRGRHFFKMSWNNHHRYDIPNSSRFFFFTNHLQIAIPNHTKFTPKSTVSLPCHLSNFLRLLTNLSLSVFCRM